MRPANVTASRSTSLSTPENRPCISSREISTLCPPEARMPSPDEIRHKLERLHTSPEEETENEEQQTLSAREKEIVVCVVKGMTNREIADRLFLSTHTVVTHRRNIARKLQVHSASGLTVYAIVNKLVELNDIKL